MFCCTATFLTCSLLFFSCVSLRNILDFALYFYLGDLIQLGFGHFSLPLCFLTSATQLPLLSSPFIPLLVGTLLSPTSPFWVIFFFFSQSGWESFPASHPLFAWGYKYQLFSFFFFFTSLPKRDTLLLTSLSLSPSAQLTSVPSSFDSSKLMEN